MNNILTVDYHKCVGCKTCEMVCSLLHEGVCSPSMARISIARNERDGWNVPVICEMCEKPVCLTVCPAGAISKNPETGVVSIDEKRCIGCLMCVQSCPFGHVNFNSLKGVAFKCDRCGGDPQCVKFCWTGALTFEPLEIVLCRKRQEAAGKAVSS